jgi:hypothetical protein
MGEIERLGTRIERKVDGLAETLTALSASMDQRFDEVTAALVEQRGYTDSAFEQLDREMNSGFGRLEREMTSGFGRLEREMNSGVGRLERKLEQFIDAQTKTNELVERRLARLEFGQRP